MCCWFIPYGDHFSLARLLAVEKKKPQIEEKKKE